MSEKKWQPIGCEIRGCLNISQGNNGGFMFCDIHSMQLKALITTEVEAFAERLATERLGRGDKSLKAFNVGYVYDAIDAELSRYRKGEQL